MSTPTFEPYSCALGTVIGHEGSTYIIVTPDGRTVGKQAAGEPSPENVNEDLSNPPPAYLSATEAIDQAQRTMDAWAQAWGYDHVARACTYVGDPHARFNAEGVALRNARSAVWAYLDAHQEDAATAEELAAILETFKPARPVPPYV